MSTPQTLFTPSVDAAWEESKHPRKANGQFGSGGGSESKKTSERHKRVKDRPRHPVKIPKQDHAIIHHNIETFGFTDNEAQRGYATRFSDKIGVTIKINNADYEDLSYTIIRKWNLK